MGSNRFTAFPMSVFSLTTLVHLLSKKRMVVLFIDCFVKDLDWDDLAPIPSGLLSLSSLAELHMPSSSLDFLPANITMFTSLTYMSTIYLMF